METFKELGEFGFINRISGRGLIREEGVLCGIGDDCAVFELAEERALLLTADLIMERVHFLSDKSTPEKLGNKLLAVNLSDVAAMGGQPRDAVISVAVPASFDVEYLERVYNGLQECAKRFQINVVGGDTTGSPGPLVLNLSLIGEMEKCQVCYRSGARPGDLIYVSGTLGDSTAGLEMTLGKAVRMVPEHREFLLRRHHLPEPRVALGQTLAQSGAVTSMIDLSDGVASDLRHICEKSGVSAIIEEATVPLSMAYRSFCEASNREAIGLALSGGEDYELLFTVDPTKVDCIENLSKQEELPPVCRIGFIQPGPKAQFIEDVTGRRKRLEAAGFEHFKNEP